MKKNIPQKIEKILENLRLQRIKKGYSQEYLGEQLGLSQVAYHKIENGKTKLQVKCLLRAVYGLRNTSRSPSKQLINFTPLSTVIWRDFLKYYQ